MHYALTGWSVWDFGFCSVNITSKAAATLFTCVVTRVRIPCLFEKSKYRGASSEAIPVLRREKLNPCGHVSHTLVEAILLFSKNLNLLKGIKNLKLQPAKKRRI